VRKPIRVCQWGLGAMGGGMARLMLEKPGLEIVAAIGRPRQAGKDLGEVLGLGRNLGVIVTDHPIPSSTKVRWIASAWPPHHGRRPRCRTCAKSSARDQLRYDH